MKLTGRPHEAIGRLEEMTENITIVEPHGRLDSTTASEFGDRLVSLVRAGRSSLVVDLKNIAYISRAGFRALLIANRAAAGQQGLFDTGGFTDEFVICPTQADGIGKLRQ